MGQNTAMVQIGTSYLVWAGKRVSELCMPLMKQHKLYTVLHHNLCLVFFHILAGKMGNAQELFGCIPKKEGDEGKALCH